MSKGHKACTIDLSCKDDEKLREDFSTLEFCMAVGSKNPDRMLTPRGPFTQDFLLRKVTNLDKEKWNVAAAVDDDEEFIVALEVRNLRSQGDVPDKEVLRCM